VSDGKCLSGDAYGPTLPNPNACRGVSRFGTLRESALWFVSRSQLVSSWAGFPVTPVESVVYLKPDDEYIARVSVTVPPTAAGNQTVALRRVADAAGVVQLISAAYGDVAPGQTVEFKVKLRVERAVAGNVTLEARGFGAATIQVIASFPCTDCHGVAGGNATWDQCFECGGKNECAGCDGVPFSGKVYDYCNVCDGTNACFQDGEACPPEHTKCGHCDPENRCLGCDGVPNSLATYDYCGVCRGTNACLGCDGQMDGKAIDRCGVCGGHDACVGCDDVAYVDGRTPKATYDACGVCGGANECVSDCDSQPFGVRRDACGVCGGDGSSCVNLVSTARPLRKLNVAADEPIDAALIVGVTVGVLLLCLCCAVACVVAYKKRINPLGFIRFRSKSGLATETETAMRELGD